MNEWLVAAIALLGCLLACGVVCIRRSGLEGVVALELASVVAALELLALSEAFGRQPFGDLAIVLAALSVPGSLLFVRYLEEP